MFLFADRIRFADPRRELIIEIRKTIQTKRVQMISGGKRFDARETWMLDATREDKVTNKIVSAHLHGNEGHPHLKGDTGLFGQHLHRPAFLNHRGERVEQLPHMLALSCEVRL